MPSSNTHSSRPGAITPSFASANVVPMVGCPATGSSFPGVKIRMRTVPLPSAGNTNVVSEKFISCAIRCIRSTGISRGGSG